MHGDNSCYSVHRTFLDIVIICAFSRRRPVKSVYISSRLTDSDSAGPLCCNSSDHGFVSTPYISYVVLFSS